MERVETREDRRTRHCLDCGYRNVPWATACSLCGATMRREADAEAARFLPPVDATRGPSPAVVLGVGAFLAPAFALLPLVRYMGWFLGSLVHEIGHCLAAWFFGAAAFPAIRIDGHAAAVHSEQRLLLVAAVFLGLLWLTWTCRHRARLRIVCGAGVLLYPLLALTDAHELLHLLAGHLGELAFGALAFYRALSGGFTESVAERIAYACVAWFLVGKNIVLDFGLMTSEAARDAYAANGSFGLTQDFVRAARELGWSVGSVGALMLLVSLAALPLGWLAWRRLEPAPEA